MKNNYPTLFKNFGIEVWKDTPNNEVCLQFVQSGVVLSLSVGQWQDFVELCEFVAINKKIKNTIKL